MGGVLHRITRGLPRGLGCAVPALWGTGRLRLDNEPGKEGLRRAQKILVRLGVKIRHPPQHAAPVNWPGLHPQRSVPPSLGLLPTFPTLSPPGLPPQPAAAKTGRADYAAPGSLWACSVAGPAPSPGRRVLPPPGRRRRLQLLPPRPGPAHLWGPREPPSPAQAESARSFRRAEEGQVREARRRE